MTTERAQIHVLAARFARAMPVISPSSKSKRAQRRPGGPLHPGLPRKKKLRERERPQVQTDALRPSLRSGLRLIGALLGEPMLVCHRRLRLRLWSTPNTWRQRRGARTTQFRRPRRCRSSHGIFASTAFRPTFVTTHTPLSSARNGYGESKILKIRIFSQRRIDRIFARTPVGQISLCPNAVVLGSTMAGSTCCLPYTRTGGPQCLRVSTRSLN
jgi:hypothetical protein